VSEVFESEVFERYRRLLFTVAYDLLGSAADAEDVVQAVGRNPAVTRNLAVGRKPGCRQETRLSAERR
jgi:hypothetical protein